MKRPETRDPLSCLFQNRRSCLPLPMRARRLRASTLTLLDRDHSILAFNQRVLNWAERPSIPLIERLRYLCIVSSNLDEFFEVRAAPHLQAAGAGDLTGNYSVQSFEMLAGHAHALVGRQYALYNDELLPSFARHGVQMISHSDRSATHRKWVRDYFERDVRPLLIPSGWIRRTRSRRWPTSRSTSSSGWPARTRSAARTRSPSSRCRACCRAWCGCPPRFRAGKTLFVALSSIVRGAPERHVSRAPGGRFLAVPGHAPLRPGGRRRGGEEPAHRAAPGLAQRHYGQAVRPRGVVQLRRIAGQFPARAVQTCRRRRCTACMGR